MQKLKKWFAEIPFAVKVLTVLWAVFVMSFVVGASAFFCLHYHVFK